MRIDPPGQVFTTSFPVGRHDRELIYRTCSQTHLDQYYVLTVPTHNLFQLTMILCAGDHLARALVDPGHHDPPAVAD